jgi:hypothetical protein
VGTGRCSPNSRVAFQPLGFDSLALRSHSTAPDVLDIVLGWANIIDVWRTAFGIKLSDSPD